MLSNISTPTATATANQNRNAAKSYGFIRPQRQPQHQPQRQPQVYSAKLHMISDNYPRKNTRKTKYISKT